MVTPGIQLLSRQLLHNFLISAVLTVGFQRPEYTFIEDSGNYEVCVTIDGFIDATGDLSAIVSKIPGTAMGKWIRKASCTS